VTRLATSFVLGYHGCSERVAAAAVRDSFRIIQSDEDYDWLGPGAYFWESDPVRAREWADWKVSKGSYVRAAVVGAVIDLRNCLDLTTREDIELVRAAYDSFAEMRAKSKIEIPSNRSPKGARDEDRVLRYLDCAVIRHLHEMIEEEDGTFADLEPFDTVRGMFVEGGEAFPGSGLYRKSHVQIAVRNPACIKGLFRPL